MPGYETKYSARQLRTFQDWIVKPQLLRVPGIAEINSLGGHLKQYEIAVNSQKLNAPLLYVYMAFSQFQ